MKSFNSFISVNLKEKRRTIILAIGLVAVGMAYFLIPDGSQPVVTPPATQPVPAQPAAAKAAPPVINPPVGTVGNNQLGAAAQTAPISQAQAGSSVEAERDPFAVPQEYTDKKNDTGKAQNPVKQPVMPTGNPVSPYGGNIPSASGSGGQAKSISLTGIVSASDGRRLAVMNDGSQSKTYQVKDHIDVYTVSAIYEDSVMLSGPDGGRLVQMQDLAALNKEAK